MDGSNLNNDIEKSKKESFILYAGMWLPIKCLSDEQLGQLFRAIYEYHTSGQEPAADSSILVPFLFFKNQFMLDEKKYQLIVDRNRQNGQKGGRPKKPKKPSGISGLSEKPKKPDNDKDNGNEKDNVNEIVLYEKICQFFPEKFLPDKNEKKKWLNDLRLLMERDGLTENEIIDMVKWARQDDFWKANFLSVRKLRKKNREGIPYFMVFQEKQKSSNGGKYIPDENDLDKWITDE